MATLIQRPVIINLELPFKSDYEYPITFNYQGVGSPTPAPVPIDITGYTFVANAYQGSANTVPLTVTVVNALLGQIKISIPKKTLTVNRNWTWDLVVTDASQKSRPVAAGGILVTDSQAPANIGFLSSFDTPRTL